MGVARAAYFYKEGDCRESGDNDFLVMKNKTHKENIF
jgi:hypothetical protein